MNERTDIMPNDIVRHEPSGETWVVCGVHRDKETMIPCGYPFPSLAKVKDCTLIERRYEQEPQSVEEIRALKRHGLESYIDAASAALHDADHSKPPTPPPAEPEAMSEKRAAMLLEELREYCEIMAGDENERAETWTDYAKALTVALSVLRK